MVHEVAAVGFGREASVYERSRPSYPPDAVQWLVDGLRIRPGSVVLDLAAGTGKLTRLLAPTGAHLIAVEPVEAMRDILLQVAPGAAALAGTAEALPLRASSIDAVAVAQAFHWFDGPRAFAELARVLRPGGRLGVVWNARDRSVDWVDRVWSVMDAVERHAPWRDHDSSPEMGLAERPGFGALHRATFRHEQVVTPAGIVERMRSVSHVAALDPDAQAGVLEEVWSVLRSHPDSQGRAELRVPYRVDCYWTERT